MLGRLKHSQNPQLHALSIFSEKLVQRYLNLLFTYARSYLRGEFQLALKSLQCTGISALGLLLIRNTR